MTIKITKQLATVEDLAIGTGTVVQERNGVPLTLTKIDLITASKLASENAGEGAALVSMEGGPSVEVAVLDSVIRVTSVEVAVLDRVIRATSIADIETYSAPVGYVFSLNAGGRSGVFDVIAGDFSTELAADTLNGIYVGQADDPTATTKVLKRRVLDSVFAEWFGAETGVSAPDQKGPIEAADSLAKSLGKWLSFKAVGGSYYSSELFLKNPRIYFNYSKHYKTQTTTQGFINWGDKPNGIVDGFVGDVGGIYANGKDNVVSFRIYGNHTRPKLRNINVFDSDFYGISIGGLQSRGDKDDVVNGLDIDGVFISSTRGNTVLSTAYSFGLEFFPGTVCKDWKIRNVHTVGKILNKFHSIDGLDIDSVNFEAPVAFNSLSSGHCEINNCNNYNIGPNSKFSSVNNFTLLVTDRRISGSLVTNKANIAAKIYGNFSIAGVELLNLTSGFFCSGVTQLYRIIGEIRAYGAYIWFLDANPSIAGTVERITLNGCYVRRMNLRSAAVDISELRVNGGTVVAGPDPIRFLNLPKAIFNGVNIQLEGAAQTYAIQSEGASCNLKLVFCTMDGNGEWNRPLLISNGATLVAIKNDFDNFTSSTYLASGGSGTFVNVNNSMNQVV